MTAHKTIINIAVAAVYTTAIIYTSVIFFGVTYTKKQFNHDNTNKIPWDNYFMNIANIVKTRSPDRTKVGAVLVSNSDNRIISTGYNGFKKGLDKTIDIEDRILVNNIIIHAETNVLLYANSNFENSTLYTTMSPCNSCVKLLSATNITKIIYKEKYKDIITTVELCKFFGITIEQLV